MTDLPNIKKNKVEVLLLKKTINGETLVAVFKRSALNKDGQKETWFALPGGKYAESDNPDETIVAGALRECKEEVGIEPKLLAIFSETLQHPKTPTTLTRYILAICEDDQNPENVDPKDNGELLWVLPSAASWLLADRAPQEVHDYLAHIARPK